MKNEKSNDNSFGWWWIHESYTETNISLCSLTSRRGHPSGQSNTAGPRMWESRLAIPPHPTAHISDAMVSRTPNVLVCSHPFHQKKVCFDRFSCSAKATVCYVSIRASRARWPLEINGSFSQQQTRLRIKDAFISHMMSVWKLGRELWCNVVRRGRTVLMGTETGNNAFTAPPLHTRINRTHAVKIWYTCREWKKKKKHEQRGTILVESVTETY
jgi:hypothetical protein